MNDIRDTRRPLARDALGLQLTDMTTVMSDWPFIIVYAPPGFGKTTLMLRCFGGQVGEPGALVLASNRGVVRPFASWCRENPELVKAYNMRTIFEWNPKWTAKSDPLVTPPFLDTIRPVDRGGIAIKVLPKLDPEDITSRAPNVELCFKIVEKFGEGQAKGIAPYTGIIWDEGTEFFRRWSAEIEDAEESAVSIRPISGNVKELRVNSFARRVAMNEFVDWLCNVPRSLESFMCFVCHPADPVYFGAAKTDPIARLGQVKYPGGPQLTTGPLRAAVSSIVDAVLHGVVLPGGARVWKTQLDDLWFRKFRDFAVGHEIPLDQFHFALWRAGYRIPKPVGDAPAATAAPAMAPSTTLI